jgi:hypothetical protein
MPFIGIAAGWTKSIAGKARTYQYAEPSEIHL